VIRSLAASDRELLTLLRDNGSMPVRAICVQLGVTATAIKQRLDRSLAAGLVSREPEGSGRGRPRFVYGLTSAGSRALGDNQGHLAGILWRHLLELDDDALKRRLMSAIANELATQSGVASLLASPDAVRGQAESSDALRHRLEVLASALRASNMPVSVEAAPESGLPVLRFSACPYPDLSAMGHDICGMEAEMLSRLSGVPMRLAECRCHAPDGKCTYVPEPKGSDTLTPLTPTPCL
jgi:predicted ArsR family transcriptional regulator